jgi:hypothetical protein
MTLALSVRYLAVLLAIIAVPMTLFARAAENQSNDRLRVMIETDAGGDPDDEQSLVRFLLYTSEFDVEGIICNRERARDGENLNTVRTGLGIVQRQIKAYSECYKNLVEHDKRFPPPDELLKRTVAGYDDTDDGVRLVIAAVDRDDPRPLWFCNWGTIDGSGESSLKRALDRVLNERGPEGYAKFKNKIRLSSDDQFGDHTWKIAPPFKIWVDTFRPEVDRKRWYHRFSGITATAGGFDIKRDLLTGHGPLAALYPTNTTHPQKEGDTMSFLYLVPTGMNEPSQPTWGSWAGRYGLRDKAEGRAYYWANVKDNWRETIHRENTLRRFAADLQNDFRARLDWCVQPKSKANHPPQVVVNGQKGVTEVVSPAGVVIDLDTAGTTDPDGDTLTYEWWLYREASTYGGLVKIETTKNPNARVVFPKDAAGKTVHVMLTVRDNGQPPLARYRRIVLKAQAPREDP